MKPISPMTFSVLENINTFLGLPDWLDNIYGQPFMNVSVMCSLLVSFGMSKEKAFEQIKDLAGTIPKGVTIPISPFDKRVFLKHLQKLLFPKKKCKLSKAEKHQLMEEVPEICQKLISEIKRLNTNQELARYWNERLIPLLNDGLSAVMAVSGIHMLPLFTTRTQIEKVAGTDMANRLCGGCVGILDCMKPLLLIEDVVDGIISKEEYVRICGHRCVNEMELMEPRPYEHPGFPDNVIKEHVSNHVSIRRMQEKEQKAYEEALLEFKETYPDKRSWIEKKIEKFRHANQAREDLRNKGVLMFCVLREYILRIGAVNNLGDDVFMLMMDEMFSMIKGEWNETDVIEARKVSYGKYLNYPTFPSVVVGRFIPDEWLSDPDRRSDFYCADFVDEEREKKKQSDMEHGDKREVRGFPGAAGVVEGTVRRITDIKDMDQIQKGEILVTIATNIGWTLVFPKVAAIVTDIGAPLSHAAIVAREFGIPAVVGCTDATSILKTGDRVRVDGAKGCVTLL